MPLADFLTDLVHKLGYNAEPPKFTAEDSPVGTPQITAQDQAQYEALLGKPRVGYRMGATVDSLAPWNTSPLANIVRQKIREHGSVAVMAPPGMGGIPRNEYDRFPVHEGIHQLLGNSEIPADEFFKQIDPALAKTIKEKLGTMYAEPSIWNLWKGEGFSHEIPARLGAGQINSLGLKRDDAALVWSKYLEMYGKTNAEKARILQEKTKGIQYEE